MERSLSVSVISHGHGPHVRILMSLLARKGATRLVRVWLTLNVPEPELLTLGQEPWPFELNLISNAVPQGFGANHNQAFAREQLSPYPASTFCILNPDLEWTVDPFPILLSALRSPRAGCAYPLQIDSQGNVQDHRRTLPTPLALMRRYFFRNSSTTINQTDWVNAAFLVFPSSVFVELDGFDVRYYMYCEDVDISLRLQLTGYELVDVPAAHVTHHASRASRKNFRHLLWHATSLWRLWHSNSYRRFVALCR